MRASKACPRGERSASRRGPPDRRGNIIVLTAFMMVMMMAFLALAVDVGYVYTMQAQLQRSVDAAALAGAGELVEGIEPAQETAKEYLVRNPVGSSMSVIDESALQGAIIQFETDHNEDLDLKVGNWNPVTRTFEETSVMPSTLKVSMEYPNMPFFFARALGHENFTIRAESTAMFQPRDIMVVLDFSASMNDDTSFAAIGKLPQATVEQSLLNCWNDLGPPSYGNLPATPTWATAQGAPQNDATGVPHVTVEYRYSQVYITSTHNLTQVKVEYSNGSQQTWSPSSTTTGTYQGSGSNAGKQIRKVWVKSWNNHNTFGSNGEYFNFTSSGINTTLKNALGLSSVTYPYSYGSWDGYLEYVKDTSSENEDAGYCYKFGGMNLVEYWLNYYPENYKIPDLWRCRAEPVYALKDATDVFMDFIQSVDTNDRVGLVIYNGSNGEATLESTFTDDFESIANIVNHRQAGHYHQYTNIGAGMTLGRQHLDTHARANAYKMMVLMTDGLANWHSGNYDLSGAAEQIADETEICAGDGRKYKVMTISMGVEADTDTMQAVADGTGGQHFNVPGGSDHQTMHEQLYEAFEAIAKARPLKLVK